MAVFSQPVVAFCLNQWIKVLLVHEFLMLCMLAKTHIIHKAAPYGSLNGNNRSRESD